jgi:hypothetical protein
MIECPGLPEVPSGILEQQDCHGIPVTDFDHRRITGSDPVIGLASARSTSAPDAPPVLGALPRALAVSRTLGVTADSIGNGFMDVYGCLWVIDVKPLELLDPLDQL